MEQPSAEDTAQSEPQQVQTTSYQSYPSYPGKVVVHGRATESAKQAAKYKRAYLIVRERWNEAQHETVEIKDKIRTAQTALQDVEDENDVLLEALLKYEPAFGQSSMFDDQSHHQEPQLPTLPQHHTAMPIKQDNSYVQDFYDQQQQHEFAMMRHAPQPQLQQIQQSIQIQPTMSTSKRSIDDIISSTDSDEVKRQRL